MAEEVDRAGRTALVVLVAEAEPLVGDIRARLDPCATGGVPAHVTVLYPFLPESRLDTDVLATLAALFARQRAFDVVLARCARFPGMVYLAPEPADPFRALTHQVAALFPEVPPYSGRFPEIIPHLTIVYGRPDHVLDAAEADLAPALPIRSRAHTVHLMTTPDGRCWETRETFPLAP